MSRQEVCKGSGTDNEWWLVPDPRQFSSWFVSKSLVGREMCTMCCYWLLACMLDTSQKKNGLNTLSQNFFDTPCHVKHTYMYYMSNGSTTEKISLLVQNIFWEFCLFTCLLSAWLTVVFLVIPRLMGQGPVYVIFKLWDKKFLEVLLRKLNLCFLFKRYTHFKMGMFWLSFRIVISIMSAVYFWERQFFWSGLVFFDSLATQRNTT